eukprot:g74176.t1
MSNPISALFLLTFLTDLSSARRGVDVSPRSSVKRFEVVHLKSESNYFHRQHENLLSLEPNKPLEHPLDIRFEFIADNNLYVLELQKNQLVGPDYVEIEKEFDDQGNLVDQKVVRRFEHVEHCFYQGSATRHSHTGEALDHGHVSSSTCGDLKGIKATLLHHDLHVMPAWMHLSKDQLNEHKEQLQSKSQDAVHINAMHVVFRGSHQDPPPPAGCDVNETDGKKSRQGLFDAHEQAEETLIHHAHAPAPMPGTAPHGRRRAAAINDVNNMEVYIANDKARCDDNAPGGGSKFTPEAVGQQSLAIINEAQAQYRGTQAKSWKFARSWDLRVVGQEFWTGANEPIAAPTAFGGNLNEVEVGDFLMKWAEYKNTPGRISVNYDTAHLFSHRDFQQSTVGYASVGTICRKASCHGIDQTNYAYNDPSYLARVGAVVAHEIGHNLGMQHDNLTMNGCPSSGYTMNAVISAVPTEFSNCSTDYFKKTYIDSNPKLTCLDPAETGLGQWSYAPVCGNGFVEEGEQCDCGSGGSDQCCNCATCKLASGALCGSSEPCCTSSCTYKAATEVCRAAADSCDIAEKCSGNSGACPLNKYLGAGNPCTDDTFGQGVCYSAKCVNHKYACSARVTGYPDDLNTCAEDNVLYFAEKDLQITNPDEMFCKVLQCSEPSRGDGYCTWFTDTQASDPSTCNANNKTGCIYLEVPNGVPCNYGSSLCYNGKCVSPDKLNEGYSWRQGQYGTCTDCKAQQYRDVTCVEQDYTGKQTVTNDLLCSVLTKPKGSQLCYNPAAGCLGVVDNPLSKTSRELADKYGAVDKAAQLRALIPGERGTFSLDLNDKYWDEVKLLFIPGIFLSLSSLVVLTCWGIMRESYQSGKLKEPNPEGYTWNQIWLPYLCMIVFVVVGIAFVALGLFYNEEVKRGLTGSGAGVVSMIDSVYDEAKQTASDITPPLEYLNDTGSTLLPQMVATLSTLRNTILLGVEPLTDALTTAKNQANSAANFTSGALIVICPLCAGYAATLQAVNNSISSQANAYLTDAESLVTRVLSQSSDLLAETDQAQNGAVKNAYNATVEFQEELLRIQPTKNKYQNYIEKGDRYRYAFNILFLLLAVVGFLLALVAVPCKQPHWLRYVSIVMGVSIIFMWIMFGVNLPVASTYGDSCGWMTSVETDMDANTNWDPQQVALLTSCLATNVSMLDAMNLSQVVEAFIQTDFTPPNTGAFANLLSDSRVNQLATNVSALDTSDFYVGGVNMDTYVNTTLSQFNTNVSGSYKLSGANNYTTFNYAGASAGQKAFYDKLHQAVTARKKADEHADDLKRDIARVDQAQDTLVAQWNTFSNEMNENVPTSLHYKFVQVQGAVEGLNELAYCTDLGQLYYVLKLTWCDTLATAFSFLALSFFMLGLITTLVLCLSVLTEKRLRGVVDEANTKPQEKPKKQPKKQQGEKKRRPKSDEDLEAGTLNQ